MSPGPVVDETVPPTGPASTIRGHVPHSRNLHGDPLCVRPWPMPHSLETTSTRFDRVIPARQLFRALQLSILSVGHRASCPRTLRIPGVVAFTRHGQTSCETVRSRRDLAFRLDEFHFRAGKGTAVGGVRPVLMPPLSNIVR